MPGFPKHMQMILTSLLVVPMAVAFTAGTPGAQSQGPTCGVQGAPPVILYEAEEAGRTFTFTYEVEIPPQPVGLGPLDVFVPLAISDAHQDILRRDLKASIPGQLKFEARYGNHFWHGHLDRSDGKSITIAVDYLVRRRVFEQKRLGSLTPRELSPKEREELALFLGPDRRVPISGPIIDQVRAELPKSDPSPLSRARAIYDFVIDKMEYKKVGTGWGNGDTFWACSAWYGNCTDYHALFISLARAEGIPARFEIGFPIPEDQPSGEIPGYHCWTQFYLPGVGWFPIDASEADKHPERRERYFGTQPADRILFTIGRDLELGEGHTTGPLNYFIYPHGEVAGRKLDGVKTRFRFAEVPEGEVDSTVASKAASKE